VGSSQQEIVAPADALSRFVSAISSTTKFKGTIFMTSAFDPSIFLDATFTEALVKRPPMPIGDYTAIIGEVKGRNWQSKDGSKSGGAWDMPLTLQVPAEIQAQLGLKDPVLNLRDSIMLDLNESGTGLDMGLGKNNKLRKYREACDLNKPGEPFSARMFTGKVVIVKLGHEIFEGEPVERINGVARPA